MLILVIVCAVVLAACGGEEEARAPRAPQGGSLVVFAKSGGVAGISSRLVVGPDGSARADGRALSVGDDDMATVRDALADARGVEGPGLSAGCSDCFVYSVQAEGVDFELDSVTYTDDATPIEQVTLVAILDELAAQAASR